MATVTEYDAATSASTSNVSTYASAAFTPAVGDLLVVAVIASGTVDAGDINVSANGVTSFTRVDRATFGPTVHSVYLFVADQLTTGTASMTVEFDCTGDAATGAIVMVSAVVGMSKTGATAIRQSTKIDDGAGATSPVFTFASACLTGNVTIYALGEISTAGILTPTNWTEGAESSYSTPTIGGGYGYRASGFTGTTVTWPGNETAHGGVFVELDTTSSGTDGTASPAVIALTSTLPAATISGGGTTAPAVAAVTTTLPAPTLRAGGDTAPAAIAVTTTLPAPTATGGGTGTPSVITTSVTLPAATLSGGGTATPTVIPLSITLPAATASGGGGGDGTATPAVIACTATLPAATASGGGAGTPATIPLSLTFPAVTVQGSATAAPTVIPVTLTAPAATISGAGTATPSVVALVTAVPNPGTSAGSTVNPATIALAITLAAAVASGQGADANPITVTVQDTGHTVTATIQGTTTTAKTYGATDTVTEVGTTATTGRTYGTTTTAQEQT